MNYALAVTNPNRKESLDTTKQVTNQKPTNINLQPGIIKKSFSKVDLVPPKEDGLSPSSVTFELEFPYISKKGGEDVIIKNEYEKISVDRLEQKQSKINDYALYLLSNIMEENFDIKGGFRIKSEESDTYQYQLNSITQSLGLIYAINEMLKSEGEIITLPINQMRNIELIRVGNLVRFNESYNDNNSAWFNFDELALEVRKAGKNYLRTAQAIEDCIDRKEPIINDNNRKENLKKKRDMIIQKLQVNNFITSLKYMKELFMKSDIQSIRDNFQRHKIERDEYKRRIIEENRDMMSMVLNATPEGFLEMDINHIGLEQEEIEKESKPLTPPKEKKKKSKAELKKEQEQNINIEEQFQTTSTTSEQYTKNYNNLTSKNIYDLGEMSQESIFKIDQEERYAKTDIFHKRKSQNKKKMKTKSKPAKQNEPQQQQQQKSKKEKKSKSNIEKSKPNIVPQSKIKKETAEFIVISLGALVILLLLYYSYYYNKV